MTQDIKYISIAEVRQVNNKLTLQSHTKEEESKEQVHNDKTFNISLKTIFQQPNFSTKATTA